MSNSSRTFKFADSAARGLVWVGGSMMIFAAFMVTIDVILRKTIGFTFGGADEISGYLFAIATAWAFPFTLLHRANVRIDALYTHLPARLQAFLDLFGTSLLALFIGLLSWRAGVLTLDSFSYGARSITPLQTPLFIPQALWLIGLILFFATLILVIITCIAALARGDLETVHKRAGALSVKEEIEGETAGLILEEESPEKREQEKDFDRPLTQRAVES